jgi:hypothetical protein
VTGLRSSREGTTGTGGRDYPPDPGLLRGVLASELDELVYPEDRCPECEKLGRLTADEKCFHRHWTTREKRQ